MISCRSFVCQSVSRPPRAMYWIGLDLKLVSIDSIYRG